MSEISKKLNAKSIIPNTSAAELAEIAIEQIIEEKYQADDEELFEETDD